MAHLTFTDASDEEAQDIHVFLTAVQDDSDQSLSLQVITAFETYDDGPNHYSTFSKDTTVSLKKYDKKTRSYVELNKE